MLWLLCGPYRAMESQALVIRIKIPDGGAVDWTVHSAPQLLFRDVLDVIGQVLPDATTTAFEYEDEDGDRITVRSDEEMKAMLSYYYSTVMEQQVNGQLIEPLQIYPRACKPPGKRNIHGLKVNTRAGAANNSSSAVSDSLPSNSLKKSSAELKKILANGQMNEQDIRYRDILGHGNGGTVYKAYHVPSGKILAVKVIPLDITLELQKQIMSELEILYKCDSSYIIGFYGAFFVENRISLCTEFMDGGSLDVYRKIPEHVLGRIAVAVVKGLTYLWSLKILHRDVKPSNMLVNTRGQVKLCDFGVSTQLVNSIAKTYVGTNAYMAPERISGEQYGIHSDVWSLGISFMEIQKNQGSLMPLQLLQCIVDEESPVLPAGEFSEPFVHFITQWATHSSCSTTMGMQKSCPCGCAGCLRSGDQPRDHSDNSSSRTSSTSPTLWTHTLHHVSLKTCSRSINRIFQDICCCLSLTTTLRNSLPAFLLLLSNFMSSDYLQLNCTQP
ncbi:dual specificity mitogen-activated protein kinase kinase 5 isoform X2 [Neopsephotus bourkii]|uniref:dual specificity mitogen-activated protein kinase kinase 5 isoform X2 n=1 Tax=Neopsephotus bourkii TaxID=309878 RepID=UPI002AA59775|nr:dual specificity mitogen-activated protein kinase kinase 5 isoform X2 [Neopsephotus bourkii]